MYDGKYRIEFLKDVSVIKSYIGDKSMNKEINIILIKEKWNL